MKQVLITAGGTSEYIDTVRKITNSSSGKLGSIIADTFGSDVFVHYVCSQKAVLPKRKDGIKVYPVVTTEDVLTTVSGILKNNPIDWMIHSMAISDYTVDYVTNAHMLYSFLEENGLSEENIIHNKNTYNRNEKIASSEDDVIIKLKKTPKIIGKIKEISPATHLIGFKLLSGVSEEELIDVATRLKNKNSCDYVVANDITNITADKHEALIIGNNNIVRVNTKQEIAHTLVNIVTTKS